jgi:gliding motility associated protien GldN
MKRSVILVISVLLFLGLGEDSIAQVLTGVHPDQHIPNRRPSPYQYIREADVMWSKTIWRQIDLRQKMNHILYYPEIPAGPYKSLIDLLMHGVKTGNLTAFNENDGNEFSSELTITDIEERFGAKDEIIQIEDPVTGVVTTQTVPGTLNTPDVKFFILKELWFFDKQRSVMDVRIIGICPIRVYFREEDLDQESPLKKKLFWVYFPEARRLFAKSHVFNPYNDSERMSFDDLFNKRYFDSYIIQESNTYNNRRIEDYTIGVESLLEAEKIKDDIFNFEQDLWDY